MKNRTRVIHDTGKGIKMVDLAICQGEICGFLAESGPAPWFCTGFEQG
jgi:hypothetical protein